MVDNQWIMKERDDMKKVIDVIQIALGTHTKVSKKEEITEKRERVGEKTQKREIREERRREERGREKKEMAGRKNSS